MKFILTKELGRLAKWLRILGFDTEYMREDKPSALIIQALREGRVILTRNHHLPKYAGIGIVVLGSQTLKEQLAEVLKTLNARLNKEMMFSRCTICNLLLVPVEKEKVKGAIPEYVFKTQDSFVVCPKCGRIYWQGTHWGNVNEMLKEISVSNKRDG